MRSKLILIATMALTLPLTSLAADVTGVWQTEPYKGITGGGGKGKYDHVRIHACEDNAENICGTIVKSFLKDGSENAEDDFLGKPMLVDLKPKPKKRAQFQQRQNLASTHG